MHGEAKKVHNMFEYYNESIFSESHFIVLQNSYNT